MGSGGDLFPGDLDPKGYCVPNSRHELMGDCLGLEHDTVMVEAEHMGGRSHLKDETPDFSEAEVPGGAGNPQGGEDHRPDC